MLANPRFAFFLHVVCNKREVGIAFLGNGYLLFRVRGLFRYGRTGCSRITGSGGHIIPWFPIGIRYHDRGQGSGWFPLRDNNRCLSRLVCCLYIRTVERCSAAVAENRKAFYVRSSAGRAAGIPQDRYLFKCGATTGAETRLVIKSRAAAAVAYDRHRGDSYTAPVAVLCQFIRYNRAAPGADRECGLFLFGHGSTAPVAELRLVIERRVAAFTTGFCHVLH